MPIGRGVAVGPNANFITGRDVRYYSPTGEDITALRQQQAAFDKVRRAESERNAWMAIPALAPAVAVLGLEGAAALAARFAAGEAAGGPLVFRPIRGNTLEAQAGQRAHAAMRTRVQAKPGWDDEPPLTGKDGRLYRPDVAAPSRNAAKPDQRFLTELKPDTPTGRKAALKAVEKYFDATGNKTRPIYYRPEDFK
jgi:hypothetical protein